MAKIGLRVYTREIEGMIEGGLIEEAVAHCKGILKVFPMHVETYRLLGKAFLEARRYGDAADIFQRTLAAVPDDFVAHVGMSIIRDDEGKQDEAIWHMERAFEVQPSNAAIQGELRRLYGRRDGVEPPKIRLTRDALANMYAQGELFTQAIAEIRAVLAEDHNRPDLQVMLARAHYRAGQKVEAAEMAATLLKRFPYCLDALRILVDVLPGTGRAENLQVYRQRLQLLDPYTALAQGSVFGSDQVADAAVGVDRLEYRPGSDPSAVQGDWASSLGIRLGEQKSSQAPPAWLQASPEPQGPASLEAEAPQAMSESKPSGESIPEWMRSAGWQEGSGAAEQPPAEAGEEAPAQPLAEAEIPDWLKSMAPAGAVEDPGPASPSEQGDMPDWLSGMGAAATPQSAAPSEAASSAPGADAAPDWLSGLAGAAAPEAAGSQEAPSAQPAADAVPDRPIAASGGQSEPAAPAQDDDRGLADWLGGLDQSPAEPGSTPAPGGEQVPDWLSGLAEGGAQEERAAPSESAPSEAAPSEQITPAEEPPPVSPVEDTRPNAAALGEDVPFQPTGEAKPLDIGDDALAWLEALAAKQGAKAEELLTKPEDRGGETPEWLRQAGEAAAAGAPAPSSGEPPPIPAAAEPVPTAAEPAPSAPQPVESDDTLAWLKGLSGQEGEPPSADRPVEEEATPVPPDLFEKVFENHKPVPPPDSGPLPGLAESQEPEGKAEAAGADEDVTVTGWLKRLSGSDAESGQPPAAAEAAPSSQEELPEWLKDFGAPTPGAGERAEQPPQPTPQSAQEQAPESELPDWLMGALNPAPPAAGPGPVGEAVPAGDERPAWLDEGAPIDQAAAPTTPHEWVPAESPTGKAAPTAEAKPPEPPPPAPPAEAAAAQPAAPEASGSLAHVPAEDKDAELLGLAQAALQGNRLSEAMQHYAKLVKKGRLLEESIHDLREAIYRFPVDVIVWQTLGDAYMRASRLQEALDAYTKAEELLR
jgi:tetratricopeptide (TPR) repeat protein